MVPQDAETIALLNEYRDVCFVRDSFRFLPALELNGSRVCWVITFQNGSADTYTASLMFDVPGTPLNFSCNIACEPYESGVRSFAWTIPKAFVGTQQRFQVYANLRRTQRGPTPPQPWANGIKVQQMPTLWEGLLHFVALPLFGGAIYIRGEGVLDVVIPAYLPAERFETDDTEHSMPVVMRYGFLLLIGAIVLGGIVIYVVEWMQL